MKFELRMTVIYLQRKVNDFVIIDVLNRLYTNQYQCLFFPRARGGQFRMNSLHGIAPKTYHGHRQLRPKAKKTLGLQSLVR